jgi:hypothetical protein
LQDGLVMVINLFEQQLTLTEALRAEVRALKDENNLLKGEQANCSVPQKSNNWLRSKKTTKLPVWLSEQYTARSSKSV